VEVADNGTGIEPSNTGKVFDMFAQMENATTRKHGGLGIGLNLAKQMLTLHGGTITVDSEGLGKGTTFIVRLPLGPPLERTEEKPLNERSIAEVARVLVIDDNEAGATTLRLLVDKLGHVARAVHNGQSGIEEIGTFKPHVVFLDIGMPGMDGYETCRRIRATPEGNSIYVVALTGWGQEEDRQRAEEAGFDQHVVKPIARATLQNILVSVAMTTEAES
jgi:CheY-like chemotaxis protein